MFKCNICGKTFATGTTLKRHVEAFHQERRTKFQCWYCNKVYARKENAVKHTQMKHNDFERKFTIIETTNTKFNPGIFKPDPWVPPPEARPRSGNIHTILIKPRTQQTTTHTASSTWNPCSLTDIDRSTYTASTTWNPCSLTDIDRTFQTSVTEDMLQEDLYLSGSDSSISSTGTDCQDEDLYLGLELPKPIRVYNAL